jgi:hypothetical protein
MQSFLRKLVAVATALLCPITFGSPAYGYAFNEIVPDVRQSAAISGGSACPVRSHQLSGNAQIAFRWSTALSSNPVTILTGDQTSAGSLDEIEAAIEQSFATWTNLPGSTLVSSSFTPLTRVSASNACASDGINSICLAQPDSGFTPGVLAFTRVISADQIGIQLGAGPAATEVGQILDADIYFDPSNSTIAFATPAALAANPTAYDFQSLMTHEIGHALGFSHSAIWSAMMYPFAAAPGTFTNARPTAQQPDAPLSDDDRTGLRVLYHDPADTLYTGSISGRIVPANPLALPVAPAGVTGVYGSHVVAIDDATGVVVAGTLGGWSCAAVGPANFDGTYEIDRLPVGHNYKIYAEPLDGVVSPATVTNALQSVCRNGESDVGWPASQACVVPPVVTDFTVRTRP